jgi:glycosyltransferase involved in cell wall biosynthesis
MSDAKVRVLLSLHQGGGAGSVNSVLALAAGLAERGLRVRLVCPPGSFVEAEARTKGLEVHPIALARSGRRANARRLAQLLAHCPVDLVNSHGSRDREAFTWLGLTRRLGVPVIFTRRSYPRTMLLENLLAGLVATRVVAVSAPVAAALRRRGVRSSRLRVIENGVLLDRLDRPVTEAERDRWRSRIEWEPGRRTVGIVARPKDQAVVLAGLDRIQTPIRLVLAGLDGAALTGPLPPLPARHRVVRLPFLDDVRPLYDLLDVVLHPSRWEALPQAVLEAMALGKPVIASRATGNAVIIRDGIDGLLVSPADPAAWATGVERLLGSPGWCAQLGVAARRRAREDFPFERTLDRTVALYRECLAGG